MLRIVLVSITNLAVVTVLGLFVLLVLTVFSVPITAPIFGLLICSVVVGFAGSIVSVFYSKAVAIKTMRVRLIQAPKSEQDSWLLETVRECASQKGIQTPEIGVFRNGEPNAFATGWNRNNALVAVSDGLVDLMETKRSQLKAVIAHEVSHVASGDMVTLGLIQGVLNTFVFFVASLAGHLANRALRVEGSRFGIGYRFVRTLTMILMGFLATLIVMWFSRRREFDADIGGAELVGHWNMILALETLKAYEDRRDGHVELPERLRAFGIINSTIGQLFRTHPPLEHRIDALQARTAKPQYRKKIHLSMRKKINMLASKDREVAKNSMSKNVVHWMCLSFYSSFFGFLIVVCIVYSISIENIAGLASFGAIIAALAVPFYEYILKTMPGKIRILHGRFRRLFIRKSDQGEIGIFSRVTLLAVVTVWFFSHVLVFVAHEVRLLRVTNLHAQLAAYDDLRGAALGKKLGEMTNLLGGPNIQTVSGFNFLRFDFDNFQTNSERKAFSKAYLQARGYESDHFLLKEASDRDIWSGYFRLRDGITYKSPELTWWNSCRFVKMVFCSNYPLIQRPVTGFQHFDFLVWFDANSHEKKPDCDDRDFDCVATNSAYFFRADNIDEYLRLGVNRWFGSESMKEFVLKFGADDGAKILESWMSGGGDTKERYDTWYQYLKYVDTLPKYVHRLIYDQYAALSVNPFNPHNSDVIGQACSEIHRVFSLSLKVLAEQAYTDPANFSRIPKINYLEVPIFKLTYFQALNSKLKGEFSQSLLNSQDRVSGHFAYLDMAVKKCSYEYAHKEDPEYLRKDTKFTELFKNPDDYTRRSNQLMERFFHALGLTEPKMSAEIALGLDRAEKSKLYQMWVPASKSYYGSRSRYIWFFDSSQDSQI